VYFQYKSFVEVRFTGTWCGLRAKPLATEVNVNGERGVNIIIIEMLQERSATNDLQVHVSASRVNVRCKQRCINETNNTLLMFIRA